MSELVQLVNSAGGEVVEEVTQSIDRPTSVYMGHGKIAELKELGEKAHYTVAVFND